MAAIGTLTSEMAQLQITATHVKSHQDNTGTPFELLPLSTKLKWITLLQKRVLLIPALPPRHYCPPQPLLSTFATTKLLPVSPKS